MRAEDRAALRGLLLGQRQAALATIDEAGGPSAAMVLYAIERPAEGGLALLIHVSRLGAHTGHLLARPRAALLIAQPDDGAGDPQALPRVAIQATAEPLGQGEPGFAAARAAYLARLPQQEQLFDFPDFVLFRLRPAAARFVGGFARAFSLDAAELAAALR